MLSCGLAHLVQLALLIRAVRRKLLLRNLRLRQCLLNALPKHALFVAGMALVDALAAAAQVGAIVRVALGVVVVRGHDLENMQLSICVDAARQFQQKRRIDFADSEDGGASSGAGPSETGATGETDRVARPIESGAVQLGVPVPASSSGNSAALDQSSRIDFSG